MDAVQEVITIGLNAGLTLGSTVFFTLWGVATALKIFDVV